MRAPAVQAAPRLRDIRAQRTHLAAPRARLPLLLLEPSVSSWLAVTAPSQPTIPARPASASSARGATPLPRQPVARHPARAARQLEAGVYFWRARTRAGLPGR